MKENTISVNNGYEVIEYTVVDEFPQGYVVWNVGRKGFPVEKCIPLVTCYSDYRVVEGSYKALYVESEELALRILHVAGYYRIGKEQYEAAFASK